MRKWERLEQSVLIMGKSTFASLFEVFVYQMELNVSILPTYSPHQNGVSERRWRTTVGMARCMQKTPKLGNEFWVRALHTAFYILNP